MGFVCTFVAVLLHEKLVKLFVPQIHKNTHIKLMLKCIGMWFSINYY